MSDQVWVPILDEDGTLPAKDAVFQAVGAASMCWEHTPTGVCSDSDRALAVGEGLIAYLQDHPITSVE